MKTIKLLPLLLTISALERGRGRDFAEGSFHSLGIVGFKSFVDGVLTPLGVLPQGFIRYRIMLGHGSLSPRSHRFILLHLGVRSNLNPPPHPPTTTFPAHENTSTSDPASHSRFPPADACLWQRSNTR
jgi:hypothetical protein